MERIMTNRLDRGFKRYGEEFEEAAVRVLRSGWYILGEELKSIEEAFASYIGSRYSVGCGNGLDALALACRAIGISEGDEVIVQGNTFIASAMGISAAGGIPVFVEPDEYYQLDPDQIESHITERTKAVMVVHLYGQTARMKEIKDLCDKHGLRIIEDCAQSHGAYAGEKISGSIGDIGCFSFYPSKNLGCFGDGGAVVTDSEEYRDRIKQLRNYGSSVRYYNEELGVNSRLDEIQAALLKVRLSHMKELTEERKAAAKRYDEEIVNPGVIKPAVREGADHVYHQYVIRCKERDALMEHLKNKGVDTIIHYPVPPHLSKAYQFLGYKEGALPITEEYAKTVLSIPMYNGITEEEQKRVIEAINEF
ncbi:MAG: DegT/DnrJ/EryC1/StrS family aminotransferase [Lachnospiraceae bacterium]|nr:DegT/DnrJ/EryC1/StrS family aminotransferase [Lachnospiraceae bacterium]